MPRARIVEILGLIADGRDHDASLPSRLCQEALVSLTVSGVGMALMTAEGQNGGVVAATDGTARQMEDLQFSLGEGPCVDASHSGRPVLQPDLLATALARWPAFGGAVLAAGVRAIFAFPLQVGAIRLGVLDLYRSTAGPLSDLDLADALAFADAATLVLLRLQDRFGGEDDAGPTDAVDDRAEVHQATGMISIQLGVSLAVALARLRAHGYAESRPVSDIAADVVRRRVRFDDTASGTSRERV